MTWWLPAAASAAGAALLWLGLRGRRVDDHPICRKCGRDLYGLNRIPRQCPECGVDLQVTPARVGNRERRERLVAGGLLLGLPTLLWIAGSAALLIGGTAVDGYKPVWLLAWEIDGAGSDRAAAELSRRMKNNDLSADRVKELVGDFLADQADLSRPWAPAKGDFIEAACVAQLIGPDIWQRYVEQGVGPGVSVRPRVRAGQPIPIYLGGRSGLSDLPRLGSERGVISGGRGVSLELVVSTDPGDGSKPVVIGNTHNAGRTVSGKWSGVTIHKWLAPSTPAEVDAMVAAGRGTVVVDVRYTWPPWAPPLSLPAGPVVQLTTPPTPLARFTVAPADVPTARAVGSEQMAEIFRHVKLTGGRFYERRPAGAYMVVERRRGDPAKSSIELMLERPRDHAEPLPLAVAYEVWIEESNGPRSHIADVRMPKGNRTVRWGIRGDLDGDLVADRVTVRLVPSVRVAESTPDIAGFWDQEVVWENVAVVRDGPPTTDDAAR